MPNMSLKKVPMPEQEPNVRNHNFQEVSLGYTKEMAMEEAARCLNCKHKPCVGGCPVNIRIPEFIAKVAEGDFQAAYDIISDTNALPSVSGRVCPQESQCEARCVRAIKGEPSAGWSALWPIGTGRMSTPCLRSPRPMASRWRWWAPAPPA